MFDFHWDTLNPPQKMLFTLLILSATSGILTVCLLLFKLAIDWMGYRKTKELVKLSHDILLADAQLRSDIYHRTQKVERTAEGTAEDIRDLQRKADKVVQTTEVVKQVVVEGATPTSLPAIRAKSISPPPREDTPERTG